MQKKKIINKIVFLTILFNEMTSMCWVCGWILNILYFQALQQPKEVDIIYSTNEKT